MSCARRVDALDVTLLAVLTAGAVALHSLDSDWDLLAWARAGCPVADYWNNILRIGYAARCLTLLLLTWSVAFLLMGAREPRAPLRESASRFGASAVLTGLVVALCKGTEWLAVLAAMRLVPKIEAVEISIETFGVITNWTQAVRYMLLDLGGIAGPCIVAVWLVLALCGELRFEPTCQEALGAIVGMGWLLLLFEASLSSLSHLF